MNNIPVIPASTCSSFLFFGSRTEYQSLNLFCSRSFGCQADYDYYNNAEHAVPHAVALKITLFPQNKA